MYSVHLKLKKSMWKYFCRKAKIAVGVEKKRSITKKNTLMRKLRQMYIPRVSPSRFTQAMSLGSGISWQIIEKLQGILSRMVGLCGGRTSPLLTLVHPVKIRSRRPSTRSCGIARVLRSNDCMQRILTRRLCGGSFGSRYKEGNPCKQSVSGEEVKLKREEGARARLLPELI